jgi:succinate dehydrogenase / fumarate reductase membrane anchor subunit
MADKPRTLSLAQRKFDFETLMWYYTRLSALAMYACAFVGMTGAFILGARTQMNLADVIRWTFMPNPNHVLNTLVPDLAPWTTLFWKVMGCTFIFFATSHGLHGLLSVIEDYLTRPAVRLTLRLIVLLFALLMTGIGIYMILTA